MEKRNIDEYQTIIVEVAVYTPKKYDTVAQRHVYKNMSAQDYLISEMSTLEESGIYVDRIIDYDEHENNKKNID
jgi:hypothetical protein|tara:strand:+ start:387 stop:608 length:222 start_codon:yes stop_codon:yes gene_type:complete